MMKNKKIMALLLSLLIVAIQLFPVTVIAYAEENTGNILNSSTEDLIYEEYKKDIGQTIDVSVTIKISGCVSFKETVNTEVVTDSISSNPYEDKILIYAGNYKKKEQLQDNAVGDEYKFTYSIKAGETIEIKVFSPKSNYCTLSSHKKETVLAQAGTHISFPDTALTRTPISTKAGIKESVWRDKDNMNGCYTLTIERDAFNVLKSKDNVKATGCRIGVYGLDPYSVTMAVPIDCNNKYDTDLAKQNMLDSTVDAIMGNSSSETLPPGYTPQHYSDNPLPSGHNTVNTYPTNNITTVSDLVKDKVEEFTDIIKMFTNFYYGFGILSLALCLMINVVNLVTAGSHPTQRHKAYENLMYCIICIALLGGVKILSTLIIQIVL